MSCKNTHEIVVLDRKPGEAAIRRMVREYFESEARFYDEFNESTGKRRRFIARMNALIAEDLARRPSITTLLSVACGTGFRENDIRAQSTHHFVTTGVDVSAAMCGEARRAGLEAIESDWLEADLGGRQFDAGVYLYSLGLVPSPTSRVAELRKVAGHLRPDAPFYVDVMNINDRNEWGPELKRLFSARQLESKGYDLGDTFYRRTGATGTAYYHYFAEQEAERLLVDSGFRVAARHYIDCGNDYGELVGPEEGAILFVAERQG